jgi:hypothetical protein
MILECTFAVFCFDGFNAVSTVNNFILLDEPRSQENERRRQAGREEKGGG